MPSVRPSPRPQRAKRGNASTSGTNAALSVIACPLGNECSSSARSRGTSVAFAPVRPRPRHRTLDRRIQAMQQPGIQRTDRDHRECSPAIRQQRASPNGEIRPAVPQPTQPDGQRTRRPRLCGPGEATHNAQLRRGKSCQAGARGESPDPCACYGIAARAEGNSWRVRTAASRRPGWCGGGQIAARRHRRRCHCGSGRTCRRHSARRAAVRCRVGELLHDRQVDHTVGRQRDAVGDRRRAGAQTALHQSVDREQRRVISVACSACRRRRRNRPGLVVVEMDEVVADESKFVGAEIELRRDDVLAHGA